MKATEEGQVIWEDELPCAAVGICGNASKIVIALRDGCLMVSSESLPCKSESNEILSTCRMTGLQRVWWS